MFLLLRAALILLPVFVLSTAATAAEPLHVEIDRLIEAKFAGRSPAEQTDDAAFLRRIWLDLAGRIPSTTETRQFLADTSPDKRQRLVDQLLAAPTRVDRLENLFHVMLQERRGENEEWKKFLRTSFEQNKPWNQMVREILNPDDQDENLRGSAFFYTSRLKTYGQNATDWPGLTRDVGRLFLGVDLQCAECHNHLFVDDYKQVEFQGLFAVFRNLTVRGGVKFPAINQQAMTEQLEFVSVFDPAQRQTGPRVPFMKEFPVPPLPEAKDGKPAPKKKLTPADIGFDPLALLAADLPVAENDLFVRNIVNRLWFAMMGRGLVMPLDLFHSGNPASHPELLDLLAREFTAHNFDMNWFLRELALTRTYQRSSQLPAGTETAPPAADFLVGIEKRLSAEQLLESMLEATGNAARLKQPQADGKPNEEYAKLLKQFQAAFANEEREPEVDFNASVKAALFLLNDDDVLNLLKPVETNLVARLAKIDDPRQLTDELFLSVLVRLPAEEERAAVLAYLEQNSSRRDVALGHVLWGMLSSIEFCVNH